MAFGPARVSGDAGKCLVILGFYSDLGAERKAVRVLKEAKKDKVGFRLSGMAAEREIVTFWVFYNRLQRRIKDQLGERLNYQLTDRWATHLM